MKTCLALLFITTLFGVTATPATAATPELSREAQLIALETGTWVSAKKHDVAAFAAVCLPDCIEIWGDGTVVPIKEVLAQVPDTEWLEYRLEDFKVTFPTENTGLVRYRVWARTTYKGRENTPQWMLASSVWVKSGDTWKAAWYQETPEPVAAPATAAVEAELLALENAWAKAYVDRDVKALERLEADDWVCTSADGQVTTKAQDIADLGSGTFQATEFKMSDLKVRIYGDTAVITGRQTEVATMAGRDASAVFRVTDVWIRRNGRWQAIATHLSREAKT